MSASRRRAYAIVVEGIWRLQGDAAARVYVDEHAPRGTGIVCPKCNGARYVEEPFVSPVYVDPGTYTAHCTLCQSRGALRPRGIDSPQHVQDLQLLSRRVFRYAMETEESPWFSTLAAKHIDEA